MASEFDFSELETTVLERQGNQDVIVIDRGECVASVSLKGGQIITYTPHGEHPVLWHNNRLDWETEDPLRQGIPICWPWFGALEHNPDPVIKQYSPLFSGENRAPGHGLVRNKNWEILSIREKENRTEVLLLTELKEPSLRLTATYIFGSDLTIELKTENKTPNKVYFSCALHSYFSVSNINSVVLPDLEGTPYLDTLKRWEKHVQSTPLTIDQEVDRAFYSTPDIIRIKDQEWHRDIAIESEDSQSAVVWNPWTEKARRLSQFNPQAYKAMLCVETAKILNDIVGLEAGESYTLKVNITTLNT